MYKVANRWEVLEVALPFDLLEYFRFLAPVCKERALPIALLESADHIGHSYLFAGSRSRQFEIGSLASHAEELFTLDATSLMRDRWQEEQHVAASDSVHASLRRRGVGFLGYDFARTLERLPHPPKDDLHLPLARFFFPSFILEVSHADETAHAHFLVGDDEPDWSSLTSEYHEHRKSPSISQTERVDDRFTPTDLEELPVDFNSTLTPDQFDRIVERTKEYIVAGDTFQANLSLRVDMEFVEDPGDLYEVLRSLNPSPYMTLVSFPDFTVVGASPEQLVRLEQGILSTRPIAGTRKRGDTPAEEQAKEDALLGSEKERAEHLMLVDLERNDLGRVAMFGSVEVDEFMTVERYSHVMHIVSNVTALLAGDKDCFDVVAALFPGGTITGAPKVRSMEIIDELEPVCRGLYTGSVGWIGGGDAMELNIAIRSIVIKEGRAYVQAGAGIVADSHGPHEYRESLKKLGASLQAIMSLQERGA